MSAAGQSGGGTAIRRHIERVEPELVVAARGIPTAVLADVMGRRSTLHGRVQPLAATMQVLGPAVTVEVRPGDNLMIHAALAVARPGDVIVVDGKGDQTCALVGEIMATQARALGVAGFVIDAAVRDREQLIHMDFPVFSVGTNPCGPSKAIAGRVNGPVSVGGVNVAPGDLVVGDADGVTVVPRDQVGSIVALARRKMEDEARRLAAIQAGDLRPAWLEAQLRVAGVLPADESL